MKKKDEFNNLKYENNGLITLEKLIKRISNDIARTFNEELLLEEQYPQTILSTITKITFYNSVNIDGDENIKILVIEVNNEPSIILDISYGLIISPLDIIISKIKSNKNKKIDLYNIDSDFQSDINFGEIKEVTLFCKAHLISKINEEIVCKSDIIEFKDYNNKCFYIDHINNDIYKREDLYKINMYERRIPIFKRHERNYINITIFNGLLNKIKKWTKNI